MAHIHNGILLGAQQRQMPAICSSMDGAERDDADLDQNKKDKHWKVSLTDEPERNPRGR